IRPRLWPVCRRDLDTRIASPRPPPHNKGWTMTKRSRRTLFKTGVLISMLALSARASLQQRLPTGQYVTPTVLQDAVQEYLNPGLPAYPQFIAGEAVRSQLSPDGTTLAILTAGQNSLYKPDGTVDVANSTQYLFLYNVVGGNKAKPVLAQVIQQ